MDSHVHTMMSLWFHNDILQESRHRDLVVQVIDCHLGDICLITIDLRLIQVIVKSGRKTGQTAPTLPKKGELTGGQTWTCPTKPSNQNVQDVNRQLLKRI